MMVDCAIFGRPRPKEPHGTTIISIQLSPSPASLDRPWLTNTSHSAAQLGLDADLVKVELSGERVPTPLLQEPAVSAYRLSLWEWGRSDLAFAPMTALAVLRAGLRSAQRCLATALSAICLACLFFCPALAESTFCLKCLRVVVSQPIVLRGPYGDELDAPVSVIRTEEGKYRLFSANNNSFAADSTAPWVWENDRVLVLGKGRKGTSTECGRWINSVLRREDVLDGFVHQEEACNYAARQTHKTMGYAVSRDEGLTWDYSGPIIQGTEPPKPGKNTGEGDCTMVDGQDGHVYAYCLRARDWRNIVARAPKDDPGPGAWLKYYEGAWSEPGILGNATALGRIGTSSAYLPSIGQTLLIAIDAKLGGAKLSFAGDHVSFQSMPEPVALAPMPDWSRRSFTEILAYASLHDIETGDNVIAAEPDGTIRIRLLQVYVEPGGAHNQRYLVSRDLVLTPTEEEQAIQVAIPLTRWKERASDRRRTTTAPVVQGEIRYDPEVSLGYLMTRPPDGASSELIECVSDSRGHRDYLVTGVGTNECIATNMQHGYREARTAGWISREAGPGRKPLYRCYSAEQRYHFVSNDPSCEGHGGMEWLLGYARW